MARIGDWNARIGGRVRLRDLHILHAVVDCGSMAKAARQLAVSQPAVSEAIAGLEHALSVKLLDRARRGVTPTVYGRALVKAGTAAFDELRQGIRQIEQLSDPDAGDLRVACPESVASGILGPIIALMRRRYPRVHLLVEPFAIGARPLFPQLENREVDLVLMRPSAPIKHPDVAIEALFNDRIRLAAATDGPWARRRKIDLAELVDAPWITVPADDIGGTVLVEAFRRRGLTMPPIAVTTFSIHLRHSLAGGAGFIAALPASVLHFNSDKLRELPIDLPEPPWPVVIATLKKRAANPVDERFVVCAREVAAEFARTTHRGDKSLKPDELQAKRDGDSGTTRF